MTVDISGAQGANMKRKIIILIGALIAIGAGVAYFSWDRSDTPPQVSQEQLQNALQGMVAKKAEKKSLQTQLAVYEKLLTQFPDSKDLKHRIEVLQQRIKELE